MPSETFCGNQPGKQDWRHAAYDIAPINSLVISGEIPDAAFARGLNEISEHPEEAALGIAGEGSRSGVEVVQLPEGSLCHHVGMIKDPDHLDNVQRSGGGNDSSRVQCEMQPGFLRT